MDWSDLQSRLSGQKVTAVAVSGRKIRKARIISLAILWRMPKVGRTSLPPGS
jgi:hypothetical protein